MKRRGELAMIARALRNGWNITPQGRSDAVALVREVLDDSDASARERLAACRVVVLMVGFNQLADDDEELLEKVKQLGRRATPATP